jgi:hypothetical protein
MAQLPEDFLSSKSFKSLSGNAFMAWIIIMVIDMIFIVQINDPLSQAKWIWVVGMSVCFVLAVIRLYLKEEKEKGDKMLLVFNAALIFLYASGMNGFTKELGGWQALRADKKEETTIQKSALKSNMSDIGSILVWVPEILGNQSSYWPDPELIVENRFLKKQLEQTSNINDSAIINAIVVENARLRDSVSQLVDDIARINASSKPSNIDTTLSSYYKKVIDTLTNRMIAFNNVQATWQNVTPTQASKTQELINSITKNAQFYAMLFETPMNFQWPPK